MRMVHGSLACGLLTVNGRMRPLYDVRTYGGAIDHWIDSAREGANSIWTARTSDGRKVERCDVHG
ncbi:hypothetical protein ASE49_12345 [Novosphingobium sp. Leaf2]|nr:hypothetical protein ASE49_12345 [Novosphingobium sp. Leaf2]